MEAGYTAGKEITAAEGLIQAGKVRKGLKQLFAAAYSAQLWGDEEGFQRIRDIAASVAEGDGGRQGRLAREVISMANQREEWWRRAEAEAQGRAEAQPAVPPLTSAGSVGVEPVQTRATANHDAGTTRPAYSSAVTTSENAGGRLRVGGVLLAIGGLILGLILALALGAASVGGSGGPGAIEYNTRAIDGAASHFNWLFFLLAAGIGVVAGAALYAAARSFRPLTGCLTRLRVERVPDAQAL